MGYLEGKGVYVGGWVKKYSGLSMLPRLVRDLSDEIYMYLRHNGPEHILVFAPTRSGKGVGLILPIWSYPLRTLTGCGPCCGSWWI